MNVMTRKTGGRSHGILGRALVLGVAVGVLLGAPLRQAAAQTTGPDLDVISWMVGCWSADGVEERWTDGAGGQMLGVNREFRDGRVYRWESLRIFQGRSRLILAANPSHQPPAQFVARVATTDSVAFHNPEHDFPTEIRYRRVRRDSMTAVVTGPGADGRVRGFEIRFGRVSCDPA